jgi:hypothetical protein
MARIGPRGLGCTSFKQAAAAAPLLIPWLVLQFFHSSGARGGHCQQKKGREASPAASKEAEEAGDVTVVIGTQGCARARLLLVLQGSRPMTWDGTFHPAKEDLNDGSSSSSSRAKLLARVASSLCVACQRYPTSDIPSSLSARTSNRRPKLLQ